MFTAMSLTGNAVFLAGNSTLAYQMSPAGAPIVSSLAYNVYSSVALNQAMLQLVQQSRSHVLENEYNRVMKRAVGAGQTITNALAPFPASSAPFNTFPSSARCFLSAWAALTCTTT